MTKKWFDRCRVSWTAFGCGFSVMVLELSGVRLIEPYSGSTIYVWGALIGIFMTALAIGYYAGGALADRDPEYSSLGRLISAAACWIFLVPLLAIRLTPFLFRVFADPRLQASMISILCFLLPCILLGMTTPYLLRLHARDMQKIGGTAGGLYAISTAGSIAGTFAVSFFLTEYMGTIRILWSTGIFLLVLGLLCLIPCRKGKFLLHLLAVILCGTGGFFLTRYAEIHRVPATLYPQLPPDAPRRQAENAVNREVRESAYHLIAIFESQINYDTGKLLKPPLRARYMRFNEHNESGCLIRDGRPVQPMVTTCGYARLLKCGLCLLPEIPENILMIGAGGGVFPQMLSHDYPEIRKIDVVDVDPAVFELAAGYFDYPWPDRENSPVRSHTADGRGFLASRRDGEYGVLILDAFTSGGRIPKHLVTREFFSLAARKLKRDGVLTMNLTGTLNSPDDEFVPAVLKTVQSVFRHVYLFPRDGNRNSNVLVAATNQEGEKKGKEELLHQLSRFPDTREQKLLKELICRMPSSVPYRENAPCLTDDFCPADALKR